MQRLSRISRNTKIQLPILNNSKTFSKSSLSSYSNGTKMTTSSTPRSPGAISTKFVKMDTMKILNTKCQSFLDIMPNV